jgi:hypothetical protein
MIYYAAGFVSAVALHIYKPFIFNVARDYVIKGIERVKTLASRTPTPPAQ